MVFPRNVGFGRCYLVSTRHEILSNIDRNAKPNRNSAAAPKKPKWNKSRESTDPTPVLLLSLQSQTVVLQPFDFHQRKSKKFIIEKLYFHDYAPTFNQTLQAQVERTIGLERIRTDFHRFTEIGRIFYNKYIFKSKKASQVEIWKWWTRLAWYPLQYGNWWNNPPSEENGTGQYAETQETGL